jgi:hypothetical protein
MLRHHLRRRLMSRNFGRRLGRNNFGRRLGRNNFGRRLGRNNFGRLLRWHQLRRGLGLRVRRISQPGHDDRILPGEDLCRLIFTLAAL